MHRRLGVCAALPLAGASAGQAQTLTQAIRRMARADDFSNGIDAFTTRCVGVRECN